MSRVFNARTFSLASLKTRYVPVLFVWLATVMPLAAQTLTGWNLMFHDEFDGTNLDRTKWNTSYPWGGAAQRTLVHGNGNELEVYWDNQFEESNGILRIRADKVDTQWSGQTYNYSSGMISSYSHFAQQYGYFEMRAKMPHGDGLWPAFWMGLNIPYWPPEVDILEILDSFEDRPHQGGIENPTNGSFFAQFYPTFDTTLAYHVYAMEWDTNHLTFYLDGAEIGQSRMGTNMTAPMQVIANLAVGGGGTIFPDASTVFPAYLDVDYIRIWSRTNAAAAIPNTVGYDIGDVGLAGSTAVWTNGTGTVAGAGTGYLAAGTNDSFEFAAEPVPGDVDYGYLIQVSSASVAGGQAGVMIRQSVDPGSPYTALYVSGGNCILQSRTSAGAGAAPNATAAALGSACWLRLIRRGDVLTGYQSSDGISWSWVGAVTNDLSTGATGTSVLVGTAVSSGSKSVLNTVQLGSVNQPAVQVIQDNSDQAGVQISGPWIVSTNEAGYYGANYMVSGGSLCSVKFTPDLPYTATYDVYLRWTSYVGRSTDAPVAVAYAGGSTVARVNQRHQGGEWVWLGAFPFAAGKSGSITISNANTASSVCADAVRFVPGPALAPQSPTLPDAPTNLAVVVSPGPGQITLSWDPAARAMSYNVKRSLVSGGPYATIATGVLTSYRQFTDSNAVAGVTNYYVVAAVNNTSPVDPAGEESAPSNQAADLPSIVVDNTNAVVAGSWNSSSTANGFYGTNYLADDNGGANQRVTFSPNLPVPGLYDVYLRWTTGTNRTTNALVDVLYDGGAATNTSRVNQQLSDGVWWVYLGTWNFTAGTNNSVRIRDEGISGYAIADAIQFIAASPLELYPLPDGGQPAFTVHSALNRHYQLQSAAALSATSWQDVGSAQAGTGGPLMFSDPSGNSGAAKFYRLRVSL